MDHIKKIEKNAKAIKSLIGLFILVISLIYGFCIFIYQNKQCIKDLHNLEIDLIGFKQEARKEHQDLSDRVNTNEKNFQMTSAKLDISLTKISADLQFIKEHLIRKGLDKK